MSVAVDVDMSILAAPWDDYRRYADGVRREYCPAVTTESRFVTGRIMFLSGVLASARIFNSPLGFERWERPARDNVARELRELKAGQGIAGRLLGAALGWMRPR